MIREFFRSLADTQEPLGTESVTVSKIQNSEAREERSTDATPFSEGDNTGE